MTWKRRLSLGQQQQSLFSFTLKLRVFWPADGKRNLVVTWCLRTYIGLRPYMVKVYIKERINDQITICAGGSPVTPRI